MYQQEKLDWERDDSTQDLQFNRHRGNWIMVQYRDTSCQIYCQALPSTTCCNEHTKTECQNNIQRQNVRRLHPAKSQYFQTAGAYFSFRGLKRLKYSWTISSEWDAGIPSCRGMQQICTGGRMKIRPTNTKILSRSVNIKPPWEWSLHRVPCSIQ